MPRLRDSRAPRYHPDMKNVVLLAALTTLIAATGAFSFSTGAGAAPQPAARAPFTSRKRPSPTCSSGWRRAARRRDRSPSKYLARIEAIDRGGPALHSVSK